MGLYLGGALVWLVLGSSIAYFGRIRGYEGSWTVLAVVGWPVALARMLAEDPPETRLPERAAQAPSESRALVVARMRCPSCDEIIRADAQSCPFCLHRLETAPVESIDWPPWPDPNARTLAQNIVVPLAFEYVSGDDRARRRILATLLFEWAEALYLRGHESARSGTRSYSLARMKNVIDERTGERLEGIEAIRDALLRRGMRRTADPAAAPAPAPVAPRRPAAAPQPAPLDPAPPAAPAADAEPMLWAELPPQPATRQPAAMDRAEFRAAGQTHLDALAPAAATGMVPDRPPPAAAPATPPNGARDAADPPQPETAVYGSRVSYGTAEPVAAPFESPPADPLDIEIPSPPGLAPLPSHLSLTPADHWAPALREPPVPRPALAGAFARGVAVAGAIAAGILVFVIENRAPPAPAATAQAPDVPSSTQQRADETMRTARKQIEDTRRELMDLVATLRAAAASVKPAPAAAPVAAAAPLPIAAPVWSGAAPRTAKPVDWSTPLTADEIRELQTMLTRLGYRPGRIDGLAGPRTASALAAWQRDRQLVLSRHPARVLLGIMRDEVARRSVLRVETSAVAAGQRGPNE